jgi:hypothetical protein
LETAVNAVRTGFSWSECQEVSSVSSCSKEWRQVTVLIMDSACEQINVCITTHTDKLYSHHLSY